MQRINELQRVSNFEIVRNDESHECAHCGTHFTGRYCPQCGMDVRNSRFTLNAVVGKATDSIGFDESGNRSILRTLRDLMWRPGYMIRDYLGGHSAAYFQPFKLLILLVIAFTLLAHVMGVTIAKDIDLSNLHWEQDEIADAFMPILNLSVKVVEWFRHNIAYSIILQNIFIVNAMWMVYRRRVPYLWTETFVAQMYICCQFMALSIVYLLLTGHSDRYGLFPYFVNPWIVLVVLLYDFYQLYDERKILSTFWHFVKVVMWLLLQYAVSFIIFLLVTIIYIALTVPEGALAE